MDRGAALFGTDHGGAGMKKLFPLLLFLISLTVAIGLIRQINMWKVIILYWIVLSVKNAYDLRE